MRLAPETSSAGSLEVLVVQVAGEGLGEYQDEDDDADYYVFVTDQGEVVRHPGSHAHGGGEEDEAEELEAAVDVEG